MNRQFPRDYPCYDYEVPQCAVYLDGERVTKVGPSGRMCVFADESRGWVSFGIRDDDGLLEYDMQDGKFIQVNRYGDVEIIDWNYSNGQPPERLET